MRLSTRARYAIRAMLAIAHESEDGGPVSLGIIAAKTGISRRYLEQVVLSLKRATLLRAVPGKSGGHSLARPAARIELREIIEAAIGPINVAQCVQQPDMCRRVMGCECRAIYALLNSRILSVLSEYTLEDVIEKRLPEPKLPTSIGVADGVC